MDAQPVRLVFRPQWLIDGAGSPPLLDHAVVVQNGMIEHVAPAAAVPVQTGDQILDLPNASLIPGLTNGHVHLVLPGDSTPFVPWIELQTDVGLALQATHNARAALQAGVTRVRDCGGRASVVLEVREAQRRGLLPGAQIVSCGWPLTITGGHTRYFGGEVDGIESIRTMVRRLVSLQVDFIKVMASGGGTPGTYPQYPSFTGEELQAIVDAAHNFGRKVAAHCTTGAAIRNAIAAGIDVIEHAMFFQPDLRPHFDADIAARLADAGIPVVPTLQVDRDMVSQLPDGPEREQWRRQNQEHRRGIARLHELGVPLLAGSDAGWRGTSFASFWRELDELVACGLTPVEAIAAATGQFQRLLEEEQPRGLIRAGAPADLVLLDGDVATDIQRLRHVHSVYQAGCLVHTNSGPHPARQP